MTILLFILKIIGIIILALLGIVLLVILAVLFVPFKYSIKAQLGELKEDSSSQIKEPDGKSGTDDMDGLPPAAVIAKAHWLLHIVGAEFSYSDGQSQTFIRIFFLKKPLNNNEAQEAEKEDKEDAEDAGDAVKDAASQAAEPSEDNAGKAIEPSEDIAGETAEPSEDIVNEAVNTADKTVPGDKENAGYAGPQGNSGNESGKKDYTENSNSDSQDDKSKTDPQTGVPGIISRISRMWNSFSDFRKKLTRMTDDEGNRRAVSHIKAEFIRLLQAIRPRKLSIDLTFSLGSPDLTGEVLGVCAWFPILYQSGNHLTPDFEADNAYAKGNVDAKGRIFLYKLLFIILRVLFDKDCKRMYRMFRKYFR